MEGSNKNPTGTLLGLFLLVNGLLFNFNGIRLVVDSTRYLEYASALRNGFYFDSHNFWYLSYVLFCYAASLVPGDTVSVIIAAQYILALLGVFSIYRAALLTTSNRSVAWITVCLLLLFPEVSQWNSYVLAESLYISMTCISLYLLSLSNKEGCPLILIVITFLVVLFTVFIKPTGFSLPVSVLMAMFMKMWVNQKFRIVRWVIPVLMMIVMIPFLNTILGTFQIMENYAKGEVIYDILTIPRAKGIEFLVVNPPGELNLPDERRPPLVKIISFWFEHPVYSIKLFFLKLFYFFVHVRPYWSSFHNLFVLTFLLPVYYFFIKGFHHIKKEVLFFSISYVLLHAVSIGLTSEDWDGRFLMPVLPVIMIIAAQGIVQSASGIIHSGEN